jgi:signal transduction histidine kinase
MSRPTSRTRHSGKSRTSPHENTSRKQNRLSERYVAALQKYLKPGSRAVAPRETALKLGRQAVALGMQTLEWARIHERAVATLGLAKYRNGIIKRAEIFFAETIAPITETHFAARQVKTQLSGLNETLSRRTKALAVSDRRLQWGAIRREVMECAAERNEKRHKKCLKESLQLQQRLRHLTHRVLAAQEDERRKISHELQDDIAQTLLGINVRLLNLKMAARGRGNLTKEIASTQRLVLDSIQTVNRFADVISRRKSPVAQFVVGSACNLDETKK